jgi:aldose 1-epimerase
MGLALMGEIVLGSADIELSILPEAGARVHRLRAFGHDILRTPDDPVEHQRDPFFWGAYQMAPWCNRIAARPTSVAGETVDLAPNFRDGTAIHGQVYLRAWNMDGSGEFSCAGGGDGWPWPYVARAHFAVDGREIRIRQSIHNVGDSAMPAGLGLHPWFRKRVQVAINARQVFDTNWGSAPAPEPIRGKLDLRSLAEMPADLDGTWTGLSRPPVRLLWPEFGIGATMDIEAPSTFVVAASPSELDAIAVEPQTHAPDGLRRFANHETGALALVEPGSSLTLETRLTFEPTQEDRP